MGSHDKGIYKGYLGVVEGECLGPTSIRKNLGAIKNLIQIPTPKT